MTQINTLTIKGYKSIKSLVDFELRPLNVLIGANGAGKSNFIGIFRFLASLVGDNFQVDVQRMGGPNALLHYGMKTTPQLEIEITFAAEKGVVNGYCVTLEATEDNRLIFTREEPWIHSHDLSMAFPLGSRHEKARVNSDRNEQSSKISRLLTDKLKKWRQYHFHDTGTTAPVKDRHGINNTLRLLPDAGNLAAYLRMLKTSSDIRYSSSYEWIVDTIRRVAPFFGDFVFREEEKDYIELE